MSLLTPEENRFLDVFLHEATTAPFTGPATKALHKNGLEYGDISHIAWAYEQDVPRTGFAVGHAADVVPPLPWPNRQSALRRNQEIQRTWEQRQQGGSESVENNERKRNGDFADEVDPKDHRSAANAEDAMSAEELGSFDAFAWIDSYFAQRARLDYEQLCPVVCFSLIWNLFETVACRRMATVGSIRNAVDHADQTGRLDRARYLEFVEFFRDRYLRDGNIEHAFERLLMTNTESQVAVRRALVGEAQDLNNIVFALLMIAHRIRNNLFHGNKGVETLHTQTELFRVVNRLLATFIEDIQPGVLHRRRVSAEGSLQHPAS